MSDYQKIIQESLRTKSFKEALLHLLVAIILLCLLFLPFIIAGVFYVCDIKPAPVDLQEDIIPDYTGRGVY